MKRSFTKLIGASLLVTLVMQGAVTMAQTTPAPGVMLAAASDKKSDDKKDKADSASTQKTTKAPEKAADAAAWTPVRRLWGYSFGDFYYAGHTDPLANSSRGGETMYNNVPTGRNAFQFRRLYLGYDYDIDQHFTAEVLLASEPNANTGVNGTTSIQNGDNLVDNKMAFFIKNFNLRYRNIWNGTDLVFGEMSTPGFALNEPGTNGPTSLSETTWAYRSIEKTITDFHKNNSYDVGAALQGTFDPATKNFGYVFMIGNNTSASLLPATSANSGFFKIFYGDIWGKFLEKKNLYIDLYADYAQTSSTTPSAAVTAGQIDPLSHSIFKAFVSYATKPVTLGVEAYTQQLSNAVTNTTTKATEDATVNAISVWARGPIVSVKDAAGKSFTKLGFFARYDAYNPDTKFTSSNTYTVNSGGYSTYSPFTKENFLTAGLDWIPQPLTAAKVHFEPNIWYIGYKDQRDGSAAGFIAADHTIVYRMTVFFTFGK